MAMDLPVFDREALQQARRNALLYEAGRQFAEKGFHGTSLASIAKGVNLTKSGLFHYVKNKEELLFQCYELVLQSAEDCIDQAEDIEGNALEKIAHYVRSHVSSFGKPGGYFAILSELYVLNAQQQKALRSKAKNIDHRLLEIIEAGISEGTIKHPNPRVAVFAIDGALNWLPKWYSEGGPYSIDEVVDAFIAFFEAGLAGS